jgi:GNAT superfamily N-acetyltransferase
MAGTADRTAMPTIQLSSMERSKIAAQLLELDADDRRLRFGCAMADEAVTRYVQGIDFERDALFGVYGADLRLVGACHVAQTGDLAEFGVSVSPAHRRRGIGSALVARAALHARNVGIGNLFMHCLSENAGMKNIARQLGMRIVTQCGESDGSLELAGGDFASLVDEMTQQGVALYDYSLKSNVAAMRLLMGQMVPSPAAVS